MRICSEKQSNANGFTAAVKYCDGREEGRMDLRKSMKRICGILLLTLMIGVLTGCKPTAYTGQEEQAVLDSASALMEDYLREHYPSAVLLRDPKAEHTLDDDDRIALSGIVDAEYELPNGKLILTVDTVTGEVSEEFFAYATIADTTSQDGSDPENDVHAEETADPEGTVDGSGETVISADNVDEETDGEDKPVSSENGGTASGSDGAAVLTETSETAAGTGEEPIADPVAAEPGGTVTDEGNDSGNAAGSGETVTVQQQAGIAEGGAYTSRDDVALYLHTYGHLPANFITKNEARALGWEGGGLEAFAPGKCIGGDYFGNYEGLLPDGNYHECDIDTLGSRSRGAKRLIYDDTGHIYYTEDHYGSFVQLY